MLAVNLERATSATRGPLPSQLRYVLAADKMTFVGFLTLHDPALDSPTAAPGPLASDAGGIVYEEWRHARLVLLPKKGGPFALAKIGVVLFVFLTSVRSCCRLYLCVGCK